MMNMRPFQIIVISVFAFLAVGGLVLFSTFKGFGGAKPVGAVTIWGTLSATAMVGTLEDLKRTHQEFGKVTYVQQSTDSFDTLLADALAAGNGPDLIITDQEHLLAERNKISVIPFSSVPERTYRDEYLPIYELFLTSNGTYAVPFVADPLVLYFNRTMLSSASVPQVPTTWEAVVGLAPHLTVKSDAGVISKSAIPFGTYQNIPDARAIISLLMLQSGSSLVEYSSGIFRSTLSSGAADSAARSPGESAVSFYTQFADPAKTVYSWNRSKTDARQSFLAGDAAFYVGYGSELAYLKSANPNLDFDMAQIPQPQTSASKTDYALAYAFAIPKVSHNSSGAFRVASALGAVTEVTTAATALGMAPSNRALLTAASDNIYAPILNAGALQAKGWLSPAPAVTDRVFADMINGIVSGQLSVRDALVAADQSLTAALQ